MIEMLKSDVFIYSDGGAIENPGPGAFGIIVEAVGNRWELAQGYRYTTNNRMELLGVIAGLESTINIASDHHTEVVTDSRYVVDGITKGWAVRWRSNDWRRNKRGDPALNSDLWARLLDLVEGRDVGFSWVRGHSGHPQNERCDAMVRETTALPQDDLDIDYGYGPQQKDPQPEVIPFELLNMSPTSILYDEGKGPELSHLDESGEAQMVDVGEKELTEREATAGCNVLMSEETLALVRAGNIDKGDVISTARLAGITGGKRTSELIPMCHNIPISQIDVNITALKKETGLRVEATAKATWRTGVEMEAMTAVSIAAITIYDMCKSAERGIRISELKLLHKRGGKSGEYIAK